MSTLENSIKLKNSSTKGPALSGPRPLIQPDVTSPEGQSGGIAKSKQVKNAGSTPVSVPGNSKGVSFVTRMGAPSNSDKTVGYF